MAEEQTVFDLDQSCSVYNSTYISDLWRWNSLRGGAGARTLTVQEQDVDLNSSSTFFYLCAMLKLLILLSFYLLSYKNRGCHRLDVRTKKMLIAYKMLGK